MFMGLPHETATALFENLKMITADTMNKNLIRPV